MHGAGHLLISSNEYVLCLRSARQPPLFPGEKAGKENVDTVRNDKSCSPEGNLKKKLTLEAGNGKLPTAPTQRECSQVYLYQKIIPHVLEVEELTPDIGNKNAARRANGSNVNHFLVLSCLVAKRCAKEFFFRETVRNRNYRSVTT